MLYAANETLVRARPSNLSNLASPPRSSARPVVPASSAQATTSRQILRFEDDSIDESAQLSATLQGCSGVQLRLLPGTHVTPLTPNLPDLAELAELASLPPLPVLPLVPPAFGEQFDSARAAIVHFLDSCTASDDGARAR